MPRMTTQIAAIIALAVLAVLILTIGPAACQKIRSMAAQGRVERSQADAASNSSADAIGAVAASGEASAASEAITRDNERRIREAQGSDAPVNPAARDAGITALCRRQAYANDPRCKHP